MLKRVQHDGSVSVILNSFQDLIEKFSSKIFKYNKQEDAEAIRLGGQHDKSASVTLNLFQGLSEKLLSKVF
ncbi:MAG: hypothetical protein B6D44_16170 [Ignavibacteriales bacterium UTCHB2]|jgi:hypothetical protein|nr:MAG: hypothetical protein BWY38_02618 [Ignavibacteria bacterium ADurb.Bin266]OQY70254.1 MAG: hypothetical protein B6D44_16170 [Ignavibacteriales bacterium UTCHB2]HQI41948.1 hypothetical protein [Ignavibacteriaceae bacterium]